MVMGTPYYMSPEQASGARDLDGRVDLYACGVILYETLTGRRPFLAANYHVLLWNILKTEPPAPRELRPDLPLALESVIARAMARDRADRYSSAAEFIAALSHVRANLANYAAPSPPPRAKSVPPPGAAPGPATATPPAPAGGTRRPSQEPAPTELPSHLLSTHESAEVPAVPRPSRRRGFDDVSTEIDGLKDFSLSEEGDATTTLMKDEDVAKLAKSSRSLPAGSGERTKAPTTAPFDPSRTEVMKPGPSTVRAPDSYADETVKMDRPDLPPSTRRIPKRSK